MVSIRMVMMILLSFPQQSMEYSGDNLWDEEETITRCVNIIGQMRLRLFS